MRADPLFHEAPRGFDRIEIRRIGRQKPHGGTTGHDPIARPRLDVLLAALDPRMRAAHGEIEAGFVERDKSPMIHVFHPAAERRAFRLNVGSVLLTRTRPFFLSTYPARAIARRKLVSLVRAARPTRRLRAPQFLARAIRPVANHGMQHDQIDRRLPPASAWLRRDRIGQPVLRHPALQRPIANAEDAGEVVLTALARFIRRHRPPTTRHIEGSGHAAS